ncbi:hypothetical protein L9W92_03875 [Pelotomaculum terephthalicicum JT]|uniref:hypothetical protein n=1 Tax=Pelotomaculum terephthalicicum TaxID=206393 RepID=UPI001F03AF87|nr:hypothetical protein [Pelotomaculum terephthalicicum]MCG9967193.1 hypothetical protein [Pelotomaculum terephthalicicum JT]
MKKSIYCYVIGLALLLCLFSGAATEKAFAFNSSPPNDNGDMTPMSGYFSPSYQVINDVSGINIYPYMKSLGTSDGNVIYQLGLSVVSSQYTPWYVSIAPSGGYVYKSNYTYGSSAVFTSNGNVDTPLYNTSTSAFPDTLLKFTTYPHATHTVDISVTVNVNGQSLTKTIRLNDSRISS